MSPLPFSIVSSDPYWLCAKIYCSRFSSPPAFRLVVFVVVRRRRIARARRFRPRTRYLFPSPPEALRYASQTKSECHWHAPTPIIAFGVARRAEEREREEKGEGRVKERGGA